jgi:hypothetical protein
MQARCTVTKNIDPQINAEQNPDRLFIVNTSTDIFGGYIGWARSFWSAGLSDNLAICNRPAISFIGSLHAHIVAAHRPRWWRRPCGIAAVLCKNLVASRRPLSARQKPDVDTTYARRDASCASVRIYLYVFTYIYFIETKCERLFNTRTLGIRDWRRRSIDDIWNQPISNMTGKLYLNPSCWWFKIQHRLCLRCV